MASCNIPADRPRRAAQPNLNESAHSGYKLANGGARTEEAL